MENNTITIHRTEQLIHFLDRKIRNLREDAADRTRIDKWTAKRDEVENHLAKQINQIINTK